MEIRKSTGADVDEMMALFDSARRFMLSYGNDVQWLHGYPGREVIKKDIARGMSYVVREGGRLLGTFMLLEGDEPTYAVIDGKWLNDRPYGTLHRIASSGERRGLVDEIVAWAFLKMGNLRGDTHEKNLPMRRAFERNGFTRCGTIWVEDGSPRIAYHKEK